MPAPHLPCLRPFRGAERSAGGFCCAENVLARGPMFRYSPSRMGNEALRNDGECMSYDDDYEADIDEIEK